VKLHTLKKAEGSTRNRKRVGRGRSSGLGKTSGRGHKGFKSRSGSRKVGVGYEGGQMPLQRRLPKRGFRAFRRVEWQEVNVRDLERHAEAVEYSPEIMQELGLIGTLNRPVKILGVGEITRKVHVKAHAFTKTAREKIAAAGGGVEEI
jgi:large subunit ribosomal protein L15